MTLKALLICTLLSACLLSCESESEDFPTKFHQKWQWIRTNGGFIGGEWTPSSTGKNYLLDLRSETVKVYRNDTLLHSGTYSLMFDMEREEWELLFNDIDTSLAEELKPGLLEFACNPKIMSDTLVLYSLYWSDGFTSRYLRQ